MVEGSAEMSVCNAMVDNADHFELFVWHSSVEFCVARLRTKGMIYLNTCKS